MHKRSMSCLLVALVLIMSSFAGCGGGGTSSASASAAAGESQAAAESAAPSSSAAEPAADQKPLRVAVQSYYCSAQVGHILDQGWDTEAGIPFEISVFNGGAPINEAMAAGLWDVAVTGGAFIYALANYDAKLIAHQVDGTGGNTVYVRPESPVMTVKGHNPEFPEVYGSPETVKDITILQNTGTSSQYITIAWMNAIGAKQEDLNAVHMDFPQIYQGFLSGQGDAASMTPPFSLGDAQKQGWAVAATLQDCGYQLLESTVATKEAYETRYDDLVKFTELLYRAGDALAADDELAFQVVKKWYTENGKDLSDEEMRAELSYKPFITSAQAKEMDLNDFAVKYGEFYISIDLIEPARLENIKAGIANDVLQDAMKAF